ncbi:MAG: hypothetical protein U5N10_19215 [Gemmobacter sp.]|nr:hypothetical protein [Gemmobacter sp.]
MLSAIVAGRRGSGLGFALPAIVLLLAFFVVPVVALLTRSVTEPELGLQNYVTLVGSSTYARIFFNTFFVSGVVTLITNADRGVSGGLGAGHHAAPMGFGCLCRHPSVDVDEPAGADLCLDGAAAADRAYQPQPDGNWG